MTFLWLNYTFATIVIPKLLSLFGYHMTLRVFFDIEGYKFMMKKLLNGIWYRLAFVGEPAPNVEAFNFNTNQKVSLLDYHSMTRPLVLIFGSLT